MDYQTLKYVIEVNKYQSISKAANNLFLSQPNISKAILNLEKELGFQIFIRNSRGISTTSEGKNFINKATKILEQFENLKKEYTSSIKNQHQINLSYPSIIEFPIEVADYINKLNITNNFNINIIKCSNKETIDNILKEISKIGFLVFNEQEKAYYSKLFQLNNIDVSLYQKFKIKIVMNNELFKNKKMFQKKI